MILFKLLHILSVIVWVGGMFFAYMVLRPSAVEVLEPPLRLRLWVAVFTRFFVWVWIAVALILLSGLYMMHLYGGHTPIYVHIMLTLGVAMMAIYAHVYFAYYRKLCVHVQAERWPDAGALLGKIRTLVGINVILGILTVSAAVLGTLIAQ